MTLAALIRGEPLRPATATVATPATGQGRQAGSVATVATVAVANPPNHQADPDTFAERAAIIEFEAVAPREWAEGYARLLAMPRPEAVPSERWSCLVDDAGRFLDTWGTQAAALGWDTAALFGCHPEAPVARYDCAGLAWIIDGRAVIAVTSDTATIRTPGGAVLRYYRRHASQPAVAAWDLGEPPRED